MTEAAQAGKDVLCINLSSGLSTTYQSACIAAGDVMEAYPDCTIYVVDSLAGCLGQGMLVEMAARKKQQGAALNEVRDTRMKFRAVTEAQEQRKNVDVEV